MNEQCPIDCGDNSCVCAGPKRGGMRTNGGCHCERPQLRQAVAWWRKHSAAAMSDSRREALEQAAAKVERDGCCEHCDPNLAAAIRALAKEPTP
jgi:hypothetical protein